MSVRQTIFLIGATGYIGGSVLHRLLAHKDANKFRFKVLVRSADKAVLLESFGVEAFVGSLADLDKLENLAAEADYVFATADADDESATKAILKGLKRRNEATGTTPVLIHTSGTGVLAENAAGMYHTDKIYNDASVEDIESLALTQIHRPVDVAIVAADQAGYAKTHIILPSTIYGLAKNPLVDKGIQNPHSIQIPTLIRASIDRGHAGIVGEGKNIWPNVDIDDVSDLYIILFDAIRSNPNTPHGREGFYFGENGEHTMYDVGAAIGEALVAVGISKSTEPTTFTPEEVQKYFGSSYLGSNSRCRADRSRSIGWKPTKTTTDFLASILPETKALIINDAGKEFVIRDDLKHGGRASIGKNDSGVSKE